jgi:hypothetical protein
MANSPTFATWLANQPVTPGGGVAVVADAAAMDTE